MQTLEILIEEKGLRDLCPVAVVADAPVSALIPALVEELNLPRTNALGHQLVYVLRSHAGGRILPDNITLKAAGIQRGTTLALDSYAVQGSVEMLMRSANGRTQKDPAFYAATTLDDEANFPIVDKHTSARLPAIQKKRRWTRRGFLVLSGTVIGASSLGLGYAAYHAWMTNHPTPMNTAMSQVLPAQPPVAKPTIVIPTTAKPVFTFMQHQQPVRAVTWAPDGAMLASGDSGAQLLRWNVAGQVQKPLQLAASIRAVAWSPDKRQLAIGAGNQITFLDARTGATLAQPTQHTAAITSLAWSPSSQQVVSGALDKQAIVWNATSYAVQTTFTRHTSQVEAVSWAPNGQTVGTSSHGGVVRVWTAATGQEIHGYFFDGPLPLRALSFAPSGMQLAVGGDDGVVRLWNGLTCQQQQPSGGSMRCLDTPQRLHAHTKTVRALGWSPDARFLATGGDDGVLALWQPAQSQMPLFQVKQNDAIRALAWSPDGKQIATASGNTVTIWALM